MSKHTPGPWLYGYGHVVGIGEVLGVGLDMNPDWKPICILSPSEDVNETDGANAALISSAPDLLEALKYVVAVYEKGTCGHTVEIAFNQCRAAIAKATGETK